MDISMFISFNEIGGVNVSHSVLTRQFHTWLSTPTF